MTQSQAPAGQHGCARCTARWTGHNTSHCGACHETFTSLSAFDKHRTGSHARSTRACEHPVSVGLVDADRAYACWGLPGDRLEALKVFMQAEKVSNV